MAIRILRNELQDHDIKVDLKEYTIKQDIDFIIKELMTYEIIALSCYIWNIELIKMITRAIKKRDNHKIIILGGPEVSYYEEQELTDIAFDYIVCGEGEEIFLDLITNLLQQQDYQHEALIIKKNHHLKINTLINKTNVAYYQKYTNDFKDIDLNKQLVYLETSRGCPYQCSYCLASLDNDVSNISLDNVYDKLNYLLDNKAKTIKLLDRTFNFDEERTNKIIKYIIEHDNHYSTFQLEITGDLLATSTITLINDYARQDLFRMEIGIQSINDDTNKAINRYQNNDLLFKNITSLLKSQKVILHLDLIAGLPLEDYESFINTFNTVFSYYPHELQLGILKLLKGTHLNKQITNYQYQFNKKACYELQASSFLNQEQLRIIKACELALNRYYNSKKAHIIIIHLIKKYHLNAFEMFVYLSDHLKDIKQLNELYQRLFIYLKDEEDYQVCFDNYYLNSNYRLKPLSNVINKKEILNKINNLKIIKQEVLYRDTIIERITANKYYLRLLKTKEIRIIKIN
jgi:radical SAM superfamily enzyme